MSFAVLFIGHVVGNKSRLEPSCRSPGVVVMKLKRGNCVFQVLVNSRGTIDNNQCLSWTALQVAGFRLYGAYGRQFVKLLHCVDDDFLADLRKVCMMPGHRPWW